jgi:hypothetical protein
VSGSTRIRFSTGNGRIRDEWALDRASLNLTFGPLEIAVGRDAFAIGPGVRNQLAWGSNAPPLDHVRLSSSRALALTDDILVSGHYVVGRLNPPQSYPGNLVTLMRAQVDVSKRAAVGVNQLLQVGGDGAAQLGPLEFLLEHVRRGNITAGALDSSNRRFGGDLTIRLFGARLYYEIMFEDIRRWVFNALRFDADHLAGVDLSRIASGRARLTVELVKTGIRSHEHVTRVTGFTSEARVVGNALGPDALSASAQLQIRTDWGMLGSWAEVASLDSDTYAIPDFMPIRRTDENPAERRFRAGLIVQVSLNSELRLEAKASLEHVERLRFVEGANANNLLLGWTAVWHPVSRVDF